MAGTQGDRESWREFAQRTAELLERRTGQHLRQWNDRVRGSGASSEAELRAWLEHQGVTGYPQTLLVWERFGYPEFLIASAEELIAAQYEDRPQLRAVLERVLAEAVTLPGTQVQARKTYVGLSTARRQFAVVRPTTKKRVDLGLRIDGQAPEGPLQPAKNLGNDTINLRIPLEEPDDVDGTVVEWLRRAHTANE